jgi:predicted short-subunit dehydrogenase-like oxidoreductase (DUF2520 family)
MTEWPRIGFIGAGRVARALAPAFADAGEAVVAVGSRRLAAAQSCVERIPGCQAREELQRVIDDADLVFLTVSDGAIAPLADNLQWRAGMAVVHCSGASGLDVLEAAHVRGAFTGSFHPLLMFADPNRARLALPHSAIALDASGPQLLGRLEQLVARVGAQSLRVPPGSRAAYHAASHYGAAFLCVLFEQGMRILDGAGISGDPPRKAMWSMARATLDALEHGDAAQVMAGAYARGDLGTATQHLQALDALDPQIASLYRALALRSVAMAEQAGRIDLDKASQLRNLLEANPHIPGETPGKPDA